MFPCFSSDAPCGAAAFIEDTRIPRQSNLLILTSPHPCFSRLPVAHMWKTILPCVFFPSKSPSPGAIAEQSSEIWCSNWYSRCVPTDGLCAALWGTESKERQPYIISDSFMAFDAIIHLKRERESSRLLFDGLVIVGSTPVMFFSAPVCCLFSLLVYRKTLSRLSLQFQDFLPPSHLCYWWNIKKGLGSF